MIENFCHFIQEDDQDLRNKWSEQLKSSVIFPDWNSYRDTARYINENKEEHCLFIFSVHAELGLMFTDKIVMTIIEQ